MATYSFSFLIFHFTLNCRRLDPREIYIIIINKGMIEKFEDFFYISAEN